MRNDIIIILDLSLLGLSTEGAKELSISTGFIPRVLIRTNNKLMTMPAAKNNSSNFYISFLILLLYCLLGNFGVNNFKSHVNK